MTWSKFGGEFPDDPRMYQLSRGVRYLRFEAIVWANKHGTDGRLPKYALPRFTDEPNAEAAAGQLVDVGIWDVDGDGWVIVGFLDEQPSAADVERTQALARDRQRKRRQHSNGDHSLCDTRYCVQSRAEATAVKPPMQAPKAKRTARVTNAVTNTVTHNTRTDTDSVPKVQGGGVGVKAPGASRRAASAGAPGVPPKPPAKRVRPPRPSRWTIAVHRWSPDVSWNGDGVHGCISVYASDKLPRSGNSVEIAELTNLATWIQPHLDAEQIKHECSGDRATCRMDPIIRSTGLPLLNVYVPDGEIVKWHLKVAAQLATIAR